MLNFESKSKYDVYDLEKLIKLLRSPDGCPWDKVQTHESIRRNFLEEAYEVAEAIDEKSTEHLCEELGDVLLQVVFHADIEREKGAFSLDDVADMVVKKLIYRHPHVFGEVSVSGADEVLSNWDALKRTEKSQQTTSDAINAVAKSLPALWRAEKVQKKAAKVGFDFADVSDATDSLADELTELSDAVNQEEGSAFDELGDVLFSAVNVARLLGIDPEEALHASCDKFSERFARLENAAREKGTELADMTPEEMDRLYRSIK